MASGGQRAADRVWRRFGGPSGGPRGCQIDPGGSGMLMAWGPQGPPVWQGGAGAIPCSPISEATSLSVPSSSGPCRMQALPPAPWGPLSALLPLALHPSAPAWCGQPHFTDRERQTHRKEPGSARGTLWYSWCQNVLVLTCLEPPSSPYPTSASTRHWFPHAEMHHLVFTKLKTNTKERV